MNWLNLKDKIVLVTGGASGIGKAIVEEYLRQGCNVIVNDISEKPEFKGENQENLLYVKGDVSVKKDVENVVDKAVKKYSKIDILVNNAGINIPRLLVDTKYPGSQYELDEVIYNKIMDINVKGIFLMTQSVARIMTANNSGVIVNVSSECGMEGSEGQGIYAASKNAMNSLTRTWCKELGKYGVRVVGIAPGIIEATGLRTLTYEEALAYTRGIIVDKIRKGYESTTTTPLGRVGKLSEIADTVVYLSSERASYIHGTTCNVAGGKTRG
ncbi:SDR family oxidoreductase [Oceanivirga salmonicida]|uniref:SDR family oxidoreductase n=1 Tax=Oceanivirga salmonicida TaxID=1769291 RepID=UPI0008296B27|nr:SDR family oxidoreductase [Oceanivirga salmonicida]